MREYAKKKVQNLCACFVSQFLAINVSRVNYTEFTLGGGDGGRLDLGNIAAADRCGFKFGGGERRLTISTGDRGERGDFRRIGCSGGERGRRRSSGERGRRGSGERRRCTGVGGDRRRCCTGDCGDRRLTGDTGGDFRVRDRLRLLRFRL